MNAYIYPDTESPADFADFRGNFIENLRLFAESAGTQCNTCLLKYAYGESLIFRIC